VFVVSEAGAKAADAEVAAVDTEVAAAAAAAHAVSYAAEPLDCCDAVPYSLACLVVVVVAVVVVDMARIVVDKTAPVAVDVDTRVAVVVACVVVVAAVDMARVPVTTNVPRADHHASLSKTTALETEDRREIGVLFHRDKMDTSQSRPPAHRENESYYG